MKYYKISDFIKEFSPNKLISNFYGTKGHAGVKLLIESVEKIHGQKIIYSKHSRSTKYIREDVIYLLAVWINKEECTNFIVGKEYVDIFESIEIDEYDLCNNCIYQPKENENYREECGTCSRFYADGYEVDKNKEKGE